MLTLSILYFNDNSCLPYFKKGALIISLGGELVEGTIKDLDNIVDLFENDGFSNVIIESKVKCD